MRTIREMLGNEEKVWVYLKNDEVWEQFSTIAQAEGFRFGELPADKWKSGHVVAVHRSGDMGHLSLFVWCLSFSADATEQPVKVDFSDYLSHKDDYSCKTPHFTSRSIFRQHC